MRLDLMPARLTEPTTAYDVLTVHFPALARADVGRVHMAEWLEEVDDYTMEIQDDRAPACGTVGCIGGWVEWLVGVVDDGMAYTGRPGCASVVLGLSEAQAHDLFYALLCDKDQGTEAHAERVIAHAAAFAERHEAQLRAKIVTPRRGA